MKYRVCVTKEAADRVAKCWDDSPDTTLTFEYGGAIEALRRVWSENKNGEVLDEQWEILVKGSLLSYVRTRLTAWKTKIDCVQFGWSNEGIPKFAGE